MGGTFIAGPGFSWGVIVGLALMSGYVWYEEYTKRSTKPLRSACPRCDTECPRGGVGATLTPEKTSASLSGGKGCPQTGDEQVSSNESTAMADTPMKPTVSEKKLMVLTRSKTVEEMYQKLNDPPDPEWVKKTDHRQEEEEQEFLDDYLREQAKQKRKRNKRPQMEAGGSGSFAQPAVESQTGTENNLRAPSSDLLPSPILDASGIEFRASQDSTGAPKGEQGKVALKPVGVRVLVSDEEYRAAVERIKAGQKRRLPS